MKKIFTSLLILSSLSLSFAQETKVQPLNNEAAVLQSMNRMFDELKVKLKIKKEQESEWANFVKVSMILPDKEYKNMMSNIKNTPEFLDSMERLQLEGIKKFKSNKDAIMKLYNVMDSEQKSILDGYIVKGFAR